MNENLFRNNVENVVLEKDDLGDGASIEVTLADAAKGNVDLRRRLNSYLKSSTKNISGDEKLVELKHLRTDMEREIEYRENTDKRVDDQEKLVQMIDGEIRTYEDPVRLVETAVERFEQQARDNKFDVIGFENHYKRLIKIQDASRAFLKPEIIGIGAEKYIEQTKKLEQLDARLNLIKQEFQANWQAELPRMHPEIAEFNQKKQEVETSLGKGADRDSLTASILDLIRLAENAKSVPEVQALPEEFKKIVVSLLDMEALKKQVLDKWKELIDAGWSSMRADYETRYISGSELVTDVVIAKLEEDITTEKKLLDTQRSKLFDLQIAHWEGVIEEMGGIEGKIGLLEKLRAKKEGIDLEAKMAQENKEKDLNEYKRLEDLTRTSISNFEKFKIPQGAEAYDQADIRIRKEDGYLAQMKSIVSRNPELADEFEEFEKFVYGKFDLHATWTAMRPAVEDEPRLIDKLPSRRAYDFTGFEINHFLNESELNPERQCRMVTKKVLLLDGQYHDVTYKETPVAMVLTMIDDIFDGRIIVPIGSSGGVTAESEERFVNGRNYHKHEGLIFKALKNESKKYSGDGTEYSDDTIRTAFRMHVTITLGHSHQAVDTPGTSDEFTKAYLYSTYCKNYAEKGKDSFTPDLPYSLLSPDLDESMLRNLTPEQQSDIEKARAMFDAKYKKLSREDQLEYDWIRQSLFEESPYKSAHQERDIDGEVITIKAHYGYTILPLMSWLTVGKFPTGKTMSFDLIREQGTEKRIWNLMPFVKQNSGPFKDIVPPDNNFMANYYADLVGTAMPLLRNVLMADPGKLMGILSSPSEIGTIVKYLDDGWIWLRNVRDHSPEKRKEDKRKFRIFLARDLAKWAISTNQKKQSEISQFLFKLEQKDVNGEPFISNRDKEVIEELVINYWLELQQEFGSKAADIIKFV